MNYSENHEVSEFSDSHFFKKKCKNSFVNCQNASQTENCEWLIRTLYGKISSHFYIIMQNKI